MDHDRLLLPRRRDRFLSCRTVRLAGVLRDYFGGELGDDFRQDRSRNVQTVWLVAGLPSANTWLSFAQPTPSLIVSVGSGGRPMVILL